MGHEELREAAARTKAQMQRSVRGLLPPLDPVDPAPSLPLQSPGHIWHGLGWVNETGACGRVRSHAEGTRDCSVGAWREHSGQGLGERATGGVEDGVLPERPNTTDGVPPPSPRRHPGSHRILWPCASQALPQAKVHVQDTVRLPLPPLSVCLVPSKHIRIASHFLTTTAAAADTRNTAGTTRLTGGGGYIYG